MDEKIRLLIVDDHEMVRMGLCAYIGIDESIEIIGQASDGEQACQMALTSFPDVILMDLVMEKMNGIEATAKIMKECEAKGKDIKIIILTSFIEEDKVLPALEA